MFHGTVSRQEEMREVRRMDTDTKEEKVFVEGESVRTQAVAIRRTTRVRISTILLKNHWLSEEISGNVTTCSALVEVNFSTRAWAEDPRQVLREHSTCCEFV
jgi:hypothetical protein